MVAMKSSLRRWGIAKGPLDLVLMLGRFYCCWELVEIWMLITEMDVAVSESVDSFVNVSRSAVDAYCPYWQEVLNFVRVHFDFVDQPRKIVQTGP